MLPFSPLKRIVVKSQGGREEDGEHCKYINILQETVAGLLRSQFFHAIATTATRMMLATTAMISTVITDILISVTLSYGHAIGWRE